MERSANHLDQVRLMARNRDGEVKNSMTIEVNPNLPSPTPPDSRRRGMSARGRRC